MSIQKILILLAIVVGGGLGAWWVSTAYPDLSKRSQGMEEMVGSVVARGTEYYTEETDLYSINIAFPDVTNAEARARVNQIVAEEAEGFKAESVVLIDDAEAARLRESERHYELVGEYKAYTHKDFVSYQFNIYLDTGGAHPNTFFRTVTFNAAGEELALEDLFVDGASYLPRLSEQAYDLVLAELARRSGGGVTPDMEDGVRLGTAPSPEALQFFYLDNESLHLLFPPYQVAAYAAGSFDIAIPLSELEDILKPELK